MKNFIKILIIIFVLSSCPLDYARADSLAEKLAGRILLQVESYGEAWYVYPDNFKRYYLGRPADALWIMTDLALGVSNADFDLFNGIAPARLSGKILLKVEDLGQAYYVNPDDLKLYQLGRPEDVFKIMKELSIGITNNSLARIEINKTDSQDNQQEADIESGVEEEEKTEIIADTNDGWINDGQEDAAASTTDTIIDLIEQEIATSTATSTDAVATSTDAVNNICEFYAEYYKNTKLTGQPTLSRYELGIDNEWNKNSPEGISRRDEFSVLWTGNCDFESGIYKFTAVFDDAIRVYVDGVEIMGSWKNNLRERTLEIEMDIEQGKHEIMVKYYEYKLNATAKVFWEKIE